MSIESDKLIEKIVWKIDCKLELKFEVFGKLGMKCRAQNEMNKVLSKILQNLKIFDSVNVGMYRK